VDWGWFMIIGWFGMGGNSFLADQFRDELNELGIHLKTCHEYLNADVPYNKDKVFEFIDQVDVIILPARKVQNAKSVNRLALAWSRKKPVVVSPLDAYLEYVEDGKDGLIANLREDWFKHLIYLKDNEQKRMEMGFLGFEKAKKYFDPMLIQNSFENLVGKTENKIFNDTFVQVIIPHYQERVDYLKLAVKSVLDAHGPDRNVYVVSSSKTNPTDQLSEFFRDTRFKCYWSKDRLSFSQANNVGIKDAHPKTTHFLLLNDDTIFGNNAFEGYFKALNGSDDIILNPYSNCDMGWLHTDKLQIDNVDLVPAQKIEDMYLILEKIRK
jgi:hypothetical protein